MKLKEKLAEEYLIARPDYEAYYENDISQNNYTDMRDAFKEGFEKAREMAVEGAMYVPRNVNLLGYLKNLGEEEV